MSEHRWGEPVKDGVRACLRVGCTVQRGKNYWQTRRGGTRRFTRDNRIPACTGTDAQEDTPSPLEVVRKALDELTAHRSDDGIVCARVGRINSALATLEESIRADATRFYREREAYFASLFGVADSGKYRADWEGAVERWRESIRAEERANVLRELADEQRHAAECVRETRPERASWHDSTATGYEGEANNIRARGKK